ncbi:MAG: FMN-binding protein [Gemmatimonadaceae bacterium]
MTQTHEHAALPVLPEATPVSSWTMLLTLGGSGAIVGLAIVLIYLWTLPPIERYKAGILRSAIAEVLRDPARCDTLYLVGGALVATRPAVDPAEKLERVFIGYAADGRPVGYAISAEEVGFSDPIEMLFGYEPKTHALLGLKILVSKETPGIADKIERVPFLSQFQKLVAPLVGAKAGAVASSSDVAMISGATISSRAVIRGINKAIDHWQPLLDAYAAQHGSN